MGPIDAARKGANAPRAATGQIIEPARALGLMAAGKISKADDSRALGDAIVVLFARGYQVWVYRWPQLHKTSWSAAELVVLFPQAGLVEKVRLRPEYMTLD